MAYWSIENIELDEIDEIDTVEDYDLDEEVRVYALGLGGME